MGDDDEEAKRKMAANAGYSDESEKELEEHREENKLETDGAFAGPRSERKCTDVLWLLLIIAHWIAMLWLGFVAFGWVQSKKIGQGRPLILTNWIDHNGHICGKRGHGGDVESKPYLYFPNPIGRWDGDNDATTAAATQAGYIFPVKSGPHAGDIASSAYGVCVHHCPNENAEKVVDYTVCDDDGCDTWDAYRTVRFISYCLPDVEDAVSDFELQDDQLEETGSAVFRFFQHFIADVIATRLPVAITGLALPFLFGYVYMVLLRVPGVLFVIVWGTILFVFLVLVALGAVLYDNYTDYKDAKWRGEAQATEKDYETTSLVCAIIVWSLAGLFLCAVCCMRKAIMLAMGIVKEAALVVNRMMVIVFLPIGQGIFLIAFMCLWFTVLCYVATAGEKTMTNSDGFGELPMPYHTYDVTDNQQYAIWYLLFDLFWTMEFVEALGQIIVATAAATYYFTRDRSTIGSGTVCFAAKHAFLYHAGTAAFGSFIIGVIKLIKAILLYVQRKCETYINMTGDGPIQEIQKKVARAIFCCFHCCIWCLEKCMKFINKEAYIQTAIFGFPFCKAARKGFFLVLRNLRRVAALESIGNAIFFITKLMIAATCALTCYIWLGAYFTEETHSITYPTLLVGILAYNLGDIFVDVVDMVADTLLICFIADEEIYGRGSSECYAPDGLKKYINSHKSDVNHPDTAIASDKL